MNTIFMYGLGAVKSKDFTIGYIEKNSFDLGGKKPEAAKIEAYVRDIFSATTVRLYPTYSMNSREIGQ